MALQDKFDSAFTEKLLKRTLVKPTTAAAVNTANDNNYELTKSNLVTLSSSFTSLQNAFNKIYAHTVNVRNLHQYDEKRLANISRQNSLENKIAPASSPVTSTSGPGDSLASTAATLDELASSVEKLNEKMKKINLNGGGNMPGSPTGPMILGDGIGTPSRTRMGRWGGRVLGAAGIGLDVFGRYQEGQSAGQIATGVGGGLAGAALGAKAGGALGALGGPAAPVTVPLGAFIGGALGYFGGSAAGDAAYGTLNTRAMGGGVKAGGAYLIGERGPEVLMLGGLSGKVIANGRRGRESQAEKNLNAAADKSSRAAAKVIKGQPPGPTSYSTKFSNYLSSLFSNMPTWLDRIKDYLGIGAAAPGVLGAGQYAPIGDLSEAEGDWKNDTEFLTAVERVARNFNIDSRDLLGLMHSESGLNPHIVNEIDAVGLIQFTRGTRQRLGVTKEQLLQMSRAQQMDVVERFLTNAGLPSGANAGQLYAAVFLPGIAKNVGWSGVLARRGDDYYESGQNRRLDTENNNDGVIDFGDLAARLSKKRQEIGLGPSPSLMGGAVSAQGFVAPVSGQVGSGFRTPDRPRHNGIDYPIPAGSPVYAAKDGNIVSARTETGFGYTIRIDHGNGVSTLYAHLREYVKTSGRVRAGEMIARSGGVPGEPGAGRSTGAHLHFELLVGNTQVDPRPYLPSAAGQTTPTPEPASRTRTPPQDEATNAAVRSLLGLPADGERPSNQFNLMDPLAQFRSPTATPNGTGGNSLRNYWATTF